MTAVTTPTGISPSSRAARSANARSAAPPSAESGRTTRAFGPTIEPDDVRHDEPDEADQAAHRDRRGRHERGQREQDRPLPPDVDAEMDGRLLAEEKPVERASPKQDEDGADRNERHRARELAPRRRVEAAEQVREDLAEGRARQVHRHREPGGQQRPDRIAGEQQRRQRRQAADPRQAVDGEDRRQGADEGQHVDQTEAEERQADRDHDRDRRPERRPGRGSRARTDRRAGCAAGPGTSPRRPRARPRRPSRSGPAAGAGPRRSSPSRPTKPDRRGFRTAARRGCRACRPARSRRCPARRRAPARPPGRRSPRPRGGLDADGRGRSRRRLVAGTRARRRSSWSAALLRARPMPPGTAMSADDGAPGMSASGWIATASSLRPSTRRGPGRVMTTSSTGRIWPSLTAVMTFQPGRAATASAVAPYAASPRRMTSGSAVTSVSSGISKLVVLPVVIGCAAGELDHLGEERVVGGGVDLAGRVQLVEDPRLLERRSSPRRPGRSRPASKSSGPLPRPIVRPPRRSARCR